MQQEHRQQIKLLCTIHIIEPFVGLLIELERKALLPSLLMVAGLELIQQTDSENAWKKNLALSMYLIYAEMLEHQESSGERKETTYLDKGQEHR